MMTLALLPESRLSSRMLLMLHEPLIEQCTGLFWQAAGPDANKDAYMPVLSHPLIHSEAWCILSCCNAM